MSIAIGYTRRLSSLTCSGRHFLALCKITAYVAAAVAFVASAAGASLKPEKPWLANLEDDRGRVDLLLSILESHPNLIRSMSMYRGRPGPILTAAKRLGPQINPYYNRIAPGLRATIDSGSEALGTYNGERIEALKAQLFKRLERLKSRNFRPDLQQMCMISL